MCNMQLSRAYLVVIIDVKTQKDFSCEHFDFTVSFLIVAIALQVPVMTPLHQEIDR